VSYGWQATRRFRPERAEARESEGGPGALIPKEIPLVSSGKKFAGEASSKKVTGLASSRPELRTFVID
jgi:hypothetical protein